jgi:hypothetical protein
LDGQLVEVIDCDKLHAAVHQRRNEHEIARESVQLRDNRLGIVLPTHRQLGVLAALNLEMLRLGSWLQICRSELPHQQS